MSLPGSITASGNAANTMDFGGAGGDYGAAADADIYSIDRDASANSWSHAEVSTSGTKGTNRVLSLDHLDEIFRKIWVRGGNPKVILTGYDTLMRIQQLLQAQQRFMEEKRVTPTFNGVKGVPGIEAGFIVATYNGVPIIPSKDVDRRTVSAECTSLTRTTCTSVWPSQRNTTNPVLKPVTHSPSTASAKRGCTEPWVRCGLLSSAVTVQSETWSDGETTKHGDDEKWQQQRMTGIDLHGRSGSETVDLYRTPLTLDLYAGTPAYGHQLGWTATLVVRYPGSLDGVPCFQLRRQRSLAGLKVGLWNAWPLHHGTG